MDGDQIVKMRDPTPDPSSIQIFLSFETLNSGGIKEYQD